MNPELNLRFPDSDHVIVRYHDRDTQALDFVAPLQASDLQDIRWYLEVYAVSYTTDVDDERANRIAERLPHWGAQLFRAVFASRTANRLFDAFQDQEDAARLLTISASHPQILALPWELLRDPDGGYLVDETPRISIRRRVANLAGGREPFRPNPKDRVRILFVVSRPKDAGFLDPRSDPRAVLDAVEQEAAGQVEVEFLRPATLEALKERLENSRRPAVDIVHFDGHGVFLSDSDDPGRDRQTRPIAPVREHPEPVGNMGYLLFEDEDGRGRTRSAEEVGAMLNRKKVGLMVLSACQSAKTLGEDPLGNVAARLTHAGIPSVLAMTHSVLVETTRRLFAQFYKHLARGTGVGAALDNARQHLYLHPERGERQRGQQRVTLKLYDWFLPALYQAGGDGPLLTPERQSEPESESAAFTNLPDAQEAGFFGRRRELWVIEQAFVKGTRRLSIAGFGGQGKTCLAQEAGRWLLRTGLFKRVCFVDYHAFQGVDAVGLAVSTLATVLDESLPDADAATAALRRAPTLLILDNLETLEEGALNELLDAAAAWSAAGDSRVLLTSRTPDFHHPAYPIEGSRKHQRALLEGLDPEDALAYFQSLMALPPEPQFRPPDPNALLELFELVAYHPLSIALLARQLKTRRPAELGPRLETLVGQTPDDPLLASLNLSLDRLDEAARAVLPRLGVFEGGAMEDDLLAITGLGATDENDSQTEQIRQLVTALQQNDYAALARAAGLDLPEGADVPAEVIPQLQQLVQQLTNDPQFQQLAVSVAQEDQRDRSEAAREAVWPALRQALEHTGLIAPEHLPGVAPPFLRFHPTLAPALRPRLTPEQQADLLGRHTQRYYEVSGYFYREDRKHPHAVRAMVRRELPNLLAAARRALAAKADFAVQFVNNVNRFLHVFGLNRDREALNQAAQALAGAVGSRAWYLARSNHGEQLRGAGRVPEAAQVFQDILDGLGAGPSYERALTLHRLGRCFESAGRPDQAAAYYRQKLAMLEQLEQSDGVKRQTGAAQTDLADVLADMGQYGPARAAYQAALAIAKEQNDGRQLGVVNGQLGTLAMREGDLAEAERRYKAALATFQRLNEPGTEAVVWHQLGYVYDEARQWEPAEAAYRESARITEAQGDRAGAARTWNQLAIVTEKAGKPAAAEAWYRKAIEGFRAIGDETSPSKILSNLAGLLQSQPGRLDEARQLAEEALAIKQTLDPGAAEIWTTYTILAKIADQQGRAAAAQDYRRQARAARAAFDGTQHELKKHQDLIVAVIAAVQGHAEARDVVAQHQAAMRQGGASWSQVADAIDRLLAGERDEDALCGSLHYNGAVIILAILAGLQPNADA